MERCTVEPLISADQKFSRPECVGSEIVPFSEARVVPQFEIAEGVYRAWGSLSPGRVPYKQELDPLRFGGKLLPYLSIIDVIRDGADYRWRLAGEKANEANGTSLSGRYLSETEALQPDQAIYRSLLDQVTRTCEPLFYVLRHSTLVGCLKRSYGVLLPLKCKSQVETRTHLQTRCILGASCTATGH